MSRTHQVRIWTKSFIAVFLTQLIIFVVFYALVTTLPMYVLSVMGRSGADAGLVVTFMTGAAIFIRLFSARILELTGKKKGLILGVVSYALITFLYLWTTSFVTLLILRFLHGLAFGFVTTATGAIAANVVPRKRYGEGIGYFGLAVSLAVVLGPFIGLSTVQWVSFRTLFLILNIIMVGAVLCALLVQLSEQRQAAAQSPKRGFSINDWIETKAIPVSFIAALAALAYSSVISFISVYADSIDLSSVASFFFLVYAAAMVVSRPFFGRRYDRLGPNHAIIPGFLFFIVGLFLLSMAGNAWLFLLSAGLIGFGFGTLTPSFQTMAYQTTDGARSGHANATFFTFFDGGIALGAFIWGMVAQGFGFQTLYISCAVLVICVMAMYVLFQARRKQETLSAKFIDESEEKS